MIAVPTLLVAVAGKIEPLSARRPLRRLPFYRIDRQQAPGFDPKWKSINLAATVPGLTRLSAAQDDANVWRICHIRSRRRLARQLVGSATPPRRWTIRRSCRPAQLLAAARWLLNAVLHSMPVVAERHTDASASVSRRRACIHLQIDRSCSWNSAGPNGD
jgi:hypothetical protein